jgi:hypothetical protein
VFKLGLLKVNNAISSSNYVASNNSMINGYWIGKDVEGRYLKESSFRTLSIVYCF